MVAKTAASLGMFAAFAYASIGCGGLVPFTGEATVTTAAKVAAPPPVVEAAPKKARLNAGRIEIDDKVQFAQNADTILPASDPLLKDVADTFKEHPEVKKVEIKGFSSAEGDAKHNKQLSDLRAKAVMAWLVKNGVPADHLTAKGYGVEQPLGDNKTEEGREKNRRVEFHVTDPAGAAMKAIKPKKG